MADVTPKATHGEHKAGGSETPPLRAGGYRELIVNDVGHGRFYEAARVGRLFTASTALGINLNVASPLGAAGTAPFALSNPVNSNKVAVILKAIVQQVLGATPVANQPVWNYIPANSGITAASNVTPVSGRLDGTLSAMKCYSSTALTGSVAASLLRPLWGDAYGVATASSAGTVAEDTDGSIMVFPGSAVAIVFNAAGTNITGAIAVAYAEIDLAVAVG